MISPELQVFLLAMLPVSELRASIPLGVIFYKLNPMLVYFLSVLGNIFVVFSLFIFLEFFFKKVFKIKHFSDDFLNRLFSLVARKHQQKVKKFGLFFLPFFVAIPLPATGGWTATLIAFIFKMPVKKAFLFISLGILLAGLVVLFLTKLGISIEKYFGWQALFATILLLGFIFWLLKKRGIL